MTVMKPGGNTSDRSFVQIKMGKYINIVNTRILCIFICDCMPVCDVIALSHYINLDFTIAVQ